MILCDTSSVFQITSLFICWSPYPAVLKHSRNIGEINSLLEAPERSEILIYGTVRFKLSSNAAFAGLINHSTYWFFNFFLVLEKNYGYIDLHGQYYVESQLSPLQLQQIIFYKIFYFCCIRAYLHLRCVHIFDARRRNKTQATHCTLLAAKCLFPINMDQNIWFWLSLAFRCVHVRQKYACHCFDVTRRNADVARPLFIRYTNITTSKFPKIRQNPKMKINLLKI